MPDSVFKVQSELGGGANRGFATVKSGLRAVRVLEHFCSHPGPKRGIDVATALDMPLSSTNDLLKTLVDATYLLFDNKTKSYSLSPKILVLADALSRQNPRYRGLIEAAETLCRETGDSVAVAVQNGYEMQCVHWIVGPFCAMGAGRLPIVGSSAGGALLLAKTRGEVLKIAKMHTRSMMGRQRDDALEQILDRVDLFRRQQYAESFGSLHPPGVKCVAISIHEYFPNTVIAIGGRGSNLHDDANRTARLIKDIARHSLISSAA